MEDIYSKENSEYLKLTDDWHAKDSPWKAKHAYRLLQKNNIYPKTVVEVGCGVGEILVNLDKHFGSESISYSGYDIATDAISIASQKETERLKFYKSDFTKYQGEPFDLLLMMDVFEHVPDYLGFINLCGQKAKYKLYHIPLDIHISSLLRNKMVDAREKVGHLHYFSKETALATIKDCGQEIVDYAYTNGNIEAPDRSLKTRLANIPRAAIFPLMPDLMVKLIGGYSLLILAR